MYMEDIKKGQILLKFLVNMIATVLKFHDKNLLAIWTEEQKHWRSKSHPLSVICLKIFGARFLFWIRVSLELNVKRLKVKVI